MGLQILTEAAAPGKNGQMVIAGVIFPLSCQQPATVTPGPQTPKSFLLPKTAWATPLNKPSKYITPYL